MKKSFAFTLFTALALCVSQVCQGQAKKTSNEANKLAREGAEKYVDAQKRLLDLAIEQLEAVSEARDGRKVAARKPVQRSWGELTEKSVKNLVAAEKSLLDLAMKPKRGSARHETR